MGKIRQEALDDAWRAAFAAQPLPEYPLRDGDQAAFTYGKHCAVAAIKALAIVKLGPSEARRAAGLARAASLSPERRREIAVLAANARWAKKDACQSPAGSA
jgi:hypothetical protein